MGAWLAAHFAHPFFLAGLGLVAAPILIWLFHRFRFQTVQWAAQTFLLRAMKRSQRRLRMENFLLLLIRCLILALFVIALARPRGRPIVLADPNDARKNVVVLLDTSYSTGYQLGSDASETVFEREKRAAKDVIRQLRAVDRFSVVAFDDQARLVYGNPRGVDDRAKKDFQDDLENLPELGRTARPTDYSAAFNALPSLLRKFDLSPDGQPPPPGTPPSPKTVFLLTDAQRSALLDVRGKLRDPNLKTIAESVKQLGAQLHIIDCGADEPKNSSILTLETREPIVGTDMPCYIEAAVKNWAGSRAKNLTFEFFVDGAETPAKSQTVDLESGQTLSLEPLRYTFHEKGTHRVLARLKSDALVVDNERALVIDVRDDIKVLLVDGDPKADRFESETAYLAVALDPAGGGAGAKEIFRPETITEGQLPTPASRLREYAMIVIANVTSLSDEQVDALEGYARDGGSIVFTMGPLVDRTSYNEKLWRQGRGVLPCKLGDVRGPASTERNAARDPNAPEWILALADREHPYLRIFADEEYRQYLRSPSVFRFVDAQELGTGAGAAQAPLRLVPRPKVDDSHARPTTDDDRAASEGSPVFVEKAFGRGRTAVWLTSLQKSWTNAPIFMNFFIIFWRETGFDFARTARPQRNLAVGERYERIVTAQEYGPNVEVTLPDGMREVYRIEALEREQFRVGYPPSTGPDKKPVPAPPGAPGAPQLPPPVTPPRRGSEGVERPGLYEVKLTGGAAEPLKDGFAVRVDPSEGDLTKLAHEDWKEALPGLEIEHTKPEDAVAKLFAQPGEGVQGNEKWPPFIAAVVGLLALESLLAAVFGRRRK